MPNILCQDIIPSFIKAVNVGTVATCCCNCLNMITKFKIWGKKCIYIDIISYLISITRRLTFFFHTKKQHDYKCDIDFIEQFNKEFNMNTLTF